MAIIMALLGIMIICAVICGVVVCWPKRDDKSPVTSVTHVPSAVDDSESSESREDDSPDVSDWIPLEIQRDIWNDPDRIFLLLGTQVKAQLYERETGSDKQPTEEVAS